MAAPMGAWPLRTSTRSTLGRPPQGQRGEGDPRGKLGAPPRANRVEPEPAQGSPCCSCPRRRGGLFFGRTGRALDTCPAMPVHLRVLRTLQPALITSPEVKPHTWSPEPVEPEPAMLPAAASRWGRAVVGGSDGEKGSPDCTAATSTETGRFGELRRPPPVGTGRFDLAQCRAAHRIYPHQQPCAGRVQGAVP